MALVDYLLQPGETAGPDTVARKRKRAQDLLAMGTDTSPVQHWSQGASRIVNALTGALEDRAADRMESEGRKASAARFGSLVDALSGSPAANVASPTGTFSTATGATPKAPQNIASIIDANVPEEMRDFAYRLAGKESSFDPAAVSPTGARGLFQFTGGTWRDITGQSVGRGADGRADPVANTRAFVALTNRNRGLLRDALGREPTYGELAVAHQQGPAGAAALLTGRGTVNPQNLAVQAGNPKNAADIQQYYGYGAGQPTQLASAGDTPVERMSQRRAETDADPNQQTTNDSSAVTPTDGTKPVIQAAGPGYGSRTPNPDGDDPSGRRLAAANGAVDRLAQSAVTSPGVVGALAQPLPAGTSAFQGQPARPAGPADASGSSQGYDPRAHAVVTQATSSPQVQSAAQDYAGTPNGQQVLAQARNAPMALLMQAMSDPWMDAGQKSLLMMLAKQRMDSMNPSFGFQTLPDGTVLRTDPRNGTVAPIYQAQPKPLALGADQRLVDPNTGRELVSPADIANTPESKNYARDMADRKARGLPEIPYGDWLTAYRRSGASNVTADLRGENAFEAKMGQEQADMYSAFVKDGPAARSDLGQIRQLRTQLARLPGGFAGGLMGLANSFGIKLGPNADAVEVVDSILNRLTPAQRQGLPGAASDRDVQMFRGALVKLSNTPEGNKLILDTMEALATARKAQSDIATKVMIGRMSRQEGIEALQSLPDPFEAFKAAGGESLIDPGAVPSPPGGKSFSHLWN